MGVNFAFLRSSVSFTILCSIVMLSLISHGVQEGDAIPYGGGYGGYGGGYGGYGGGYGGYGGYGGGRGGWGGGGGGRWGGPYGGYGGGYGRPGLVIVG
ncbi:unnamed protein product [Orchesella dallaii]|uniref:Uncharacterized protein n=1 Tax=Orchesella dallaii TaxID=48710 RepID=A0ABP1RX78_9HEXA